MQAQIVFPPDLSINRLEVVQTVQDEGQTVPLIAGKVTGVRAFVRQQLRPEAPVAGVTVFLRGFRDGVEIAGSPLRAVNGPITASQQPDRSNPAHSLDFILPVEWTAAGRLELRAELRLPPNTSEGPSDNNNLRREVEFVAPAVNQFRVAWVPVCLAGSACPASGVQYQGLAGRLLPLRDGTLSYEDVPVPPVQWSDGVATEAGSQGLLNLLRKWRLFLEDSPLRADFALGWLPVGTVAFDAAQRSANGRASWIVEQADAVWNQRMVVQQLTPAPVSGECESGIGDVGFDAVGGRVIPPSRNRVLSRCAQSSGSPWLSAADARALSFGALSTQGAAATDGWVISGVVRRDGTGRLDGAYPVRSSIAAPASQDTTEACLILDSGSFCFFPFLDASEEGTFAFRLPGAASNVKLMINGVEAASLVATGQAPVVAISSVQEGDSWNSVRTLEWTASDPAGRALTYAVFYSNDDGAGWIPLALDVREPRLSVDPQYLLAGAVRFRVIASAGLDAAEAVSGSVDVPRGARLLLPESTLNFGNATTGQVAERGIVVQNAGSGPLELRPAAAPADAFAFAEPTPLRVRAGLERNLNLRYRPRIPGQESADLALATNDPQNEQVTVAVRASSFERLVPNSLISPRILDFGQVRVGDTRELPFVVRNDGTAPLSVTSLSTLNARFTAVAPAGVVTIAAGEERAFAARFVPLGGGSQTGTLNVATNDPTSPTLRLELRGAGLQTFTPVIQVDRTSLSFGSLTIGQTSPILPVVVRNTGNGPLSILSLTMSNPAFAVLSPATLPVTVAPATEQVISIRFAPNAAGAQTGTLTIESSDPDRARVSVELTGSGSQPAASVEPRISYVAPVTLRPVPAGYNIRFNITVYGSNFGPGAKVFFNGTERPTEVLSGTVVRGSLTADDVASPREYDVTVVNPPPGGGTSNVYRVLVTPQPGTTATAQIHEMNTSACPTVTASVAVTNRAGLPITAINNSNLLCTDDGAVAPCTVRRALNVESQVSVLMVLHTSASVLDGQVKRARDLGFIQQIANRFVDGVDETTRIMVTYMDSGVRPAPTTLEFKDGVNKGALKDAVNGISTTLPAGPGTALYDAIEDGLNRLAGQGSRRKALVLFTASPNTFDTNGTRNLNALFQLAQSSGVPIFLVPVGDGIQNTSLVSVLNQFAADSGGRVLIDRGSSLSEEINRLASEIDGMHLVDFPAQRRDGQPHKLQIRFTLPDGVFDTAKVYPGCR